MRFLYATLLFFAALVLPELVVAADASNWRKDLYTGSFDVQRRQERIRIANGLLEKVQEIRAFVPSLTPSQIDWLAEERSTFDNLEGDVLHRKLISFSLSNEYQQETLIDGLERIIGALNCVANPNVALPIEVKCWAHTTWELTDSGMFNDSINRLTRSGFVQFPENVREQLWLNYSEDEPWGGFHMFGRSIQKNLVIPLIDQIAK